MLRALPLVLMEIWLRVCPAKLKLPPSLLLDQSCQVSLHITQCLLDVNSFKEHSTVLLWSFSVNSLVMYWSDSPSLLLDQSCQVSLHITQCLLDVNSFKEHSTVLLWSFSVNSLVMYWSDS